MLTKTDYTTGLKCGKKLWLSKHMPEEKSAPNRVAQRRMSVGTQIGQIAKGLYPGGITIRHWEIGNPAAALETAELMNAGTDVIFEATFMVDDLLARVDILTRDCDGWRINEVKSSSKYTPDHLPDVAFQASLLTRAGHTLSGASLICIDSSYIWEGGDWVVEKLLKSEDITEDVMKAYPGVLDSVNLYLALLKQDEYPPVDGVAPYVDPVVRAACKGCEFGGHCKPKAPSDHIFFLGLHHTKTEKLIKAGIRQIGQVPSDTKMTNAERLRFDAFINDRPAIAPDLGERLAQIQYPAHFIDFETVRPELPLFVGHSPYLHLPFQWSCHTLEGSPDASTTDQDLGHSEFLHQEVSDPREAFVNSLLAQLDSGGSILHYHGFEKNAINEMAAAGVPGAERLQEMFGRFIDLLAIVKECYADSRFLGKTSIKNVLPVVAPGLSYSSLNIQNGDDAQIAYGSFLSGSLDQAESAQLFTDLLAYCKLDTWAMVEVLKALNVAANQ